MYWLNNIKSIDEKRTEFHARKKREKKNQRKNQYIYLQSFGFSVWARLDLSPFQKCVESTTRIESNQIKYTVVSSPSTKNSSIKYQSIVVVFVVIIIINIVAGTWWRNFRLSATYIYIYEINRCKTQCLTYIGNGCIDMNRTSKIIIKKERTENLLLFLRFQFGDDFTWAEFCLIHVWECVSVVCLCLCLSVLLLVLLMLLLLLSLLLLSQCSILLWYMWLLFTSFGVFHVSSARVRAIHHSVYMDAVGKSLLFSFVCQLCMFFSFLSFYRVLCMVFFSSFAFYFCCRLFSMFKRWCVCSEAGGWRSFGCHSERKRVYDKRAT